MLPWTDHTLIHVLLFGGLAGLIMATRYIPDVRAERPDRFDFVGFVLSGLGIGGLAFGWSDDGLHFHPADPGSTTDTPATNAFTEAAAINTFAWHGSMVADPRSGWVYTAIACTPDNGCPNNSNANEVGVAVGKPDPTDPANLERVGGRGLLLIRTFMDEVTFNDRGNQITLVKRRESKAALGEACVVVAASSVSACSRANCPGR